MYIWYSVIICLVVAFIAYKIGHNTAVKPVQESNIKILQERKHITENIELLKEQLNVLEATSASLNQSIQDSQILAQTAYEEQKKNLDAQFGRDSEQYTQRINSLKDQEEETRQKLESIKATYAASIKANIQAQEVKDNKDNYCLKLSATDKSDVRILNTLVKDFSKPRAIYMCIWTNYYQPIAKKKFTKILGQTNAVAGIYKITNQLTDECYIGQSLDCRKRWYEHCKLGIGIDTPANNLLYKAMQEYGLDNFSFELIEECSPSELNEKEKYFIELYAANVVGYNSKSGNN